MFKDLRENQRSKLTLFEVEGMQFFGRESCLLFKFAHSDVFQQLMLNQTLWQLIMIYFTNFKSYILYHQIKQF